MQNYTNWLKNCIDGIRNVNLGDVSGYGQALYWQLMFLGTIILTLIVVAAVLFIIGIGPALYFKKQKKLFVTDIESAVQKMEGAKEINIDDEKSIHVRIRLDYNEKRKIGDKYIKHCRNLSSFILVITVFFTLPFFIEFLTKITVPSLIGGIIFLIIMFFIIIDIISTLIDEELLYDLFWTNFINPVSTSDDIYKNYNCFKTIYFKERGCYAEILNVSDDFNRNILNQTIISYINNIHLGESFEDNIAAIKKWMLETIMPEYEKQMKLQEQTTNNDEKQKS